MEGNRPRPVSTIYAAGAALPLVIRDYAITLFAVITLCFRFGAALTAMCNHLARRRPHEYTFTGPNSPTSHLRRRRTHIFSPDGLPNRLAYGLTREIDSSHSVAGDGPFRATDLSDSSRHSHISGLPTTATYIDFHQRSIRCPKHSVVDGQTQK